MLLSLRNICVDYTKSCGLFVPEEKIHAVRNVSFDIERGEILTIVGDSGCGKTTLGKVITGLLKPTSGELLYEGVNVYRSLGTQFKKYRAGVQFVQQDSYAALNPVNTIYDSLYAPLKKHLGLRPDLDDLIKHYLELVQLAPAEQFLYKYPHQLSGGQRQRVILARALLMDPKLIVADEPISMIDVSLRLSVLKLFSDLNKTMGISFVYITHDLSTARYISQGGKMLVMYYGQKLEYGETDRILSNPLHPYTQLLLTAVPIPDPRIEKNKKALPMKSVDEIGIPTHGCSFSNRCLFAQGRCRSSDDIPYKSVDGDEVKCCNLENVKPFSLKEWIKQK
jgi:oligopeptide/dipeptide ABC transporter ATP-binding protein